MEQQQGEGSREEVLRGVGLSCYWVQLLVSTASVQLGWQSVVQAGMSQCVALEASRYYAFALGTAMYEQRGVFSLSSRMTCGYINM